MARTESKMLALGTTLPVFKLKDTDGKLVGPEDFKNAKGYLVMFICNHCPFVIHIRKTLSEMTQEYIDRDIATFGISSNDIEMYPEDSPDKMALEKKNYNYRFPYLFDESQDVARAFHAACTPEFYLFDSSKKLVYRGQFCDSRPSNGVPVTGKDLKLAMDNLLAGREISEVQKPSMGCSIKWKS